MLFKNNLQNLNGIVFFDIDDTLLDTSIYHKKVREYVFSKLINFGLNSSIDELWNLFWKIYNEYGGNYNYHYDRVLENFNLDKKDFENFKNLAIRFHRDFRDNNLKNYLVEGSKELLIYLGENNFQLGIISSGVYEKQIDKLKFLGIYGFFRKDLINIKLNKDFKLYFKIYRNTIRKYKNDNIWFIGDREDKDIIPAKTAGFKTIRIKNGKYQLDFNKSIANYKFESFKEIDFSIFNVKNEF